MAGRVVRIGLLQMGVSHERDDNLAKASRMVRDAAKLGADVVCLPELFGSRYFPAQRGRHPSPETVP